MLNKVSHKKHYKTLFAAFLLFGMLVFNLASSPHETKPEGEEQCGKT